MARVRSPEWRRDPHRDEGRDLADWTDAQANGTQGLRHLRELVEKTSAALSDTTEPETRTHLAAAPETLAGVESLVASSPHAPSTDVPVVHCGPAMLAVLPPRPLSWADEQGVLRAVVQIGRSQATYADLVARRAILSQRACSRRGQRCRGLAPGKVMGGVQGRTAACGPRGAKRLGLEDRSNLLRRWFAVRARPCDQRSQRGKASASERCL